MSNVYSLPPIATMLRKYGVGAQILKDLGVRRMRVLSAPKQMHGISALEMAHLLDKREPLTVAAHPAAARAKQGTDNVG